MSRAPRNTAPLYGGSTFRVSMRRWKRRVSKANGGVQPCSEALMIRLRFSVFQLKISFDELAESLCFEGFVKSLRSRLADPEEGGVLGAYVAVTKDTHNGDIRFFTSPPAIYLDQMELLPMEDHVWRYHCFRG